MAPVKKQPHERKRHFLKEWRESKDVSQEVAAERAGISRSNLSKIETGQVPYGQDIIERLAEAYGCEVSDLLERSPLWSARIPIFDLPAGDIERVREFVKALRITRSEPSPDKETKKPVRLPSPAKSTTKAS